jgi:hypothetical protein
MTPSQMHAEALKIAKALPLIYTQSSKRRLIHRLLGMHSQALKAGKQ